MLLRRWSIATCAILTLACGRGPSDRAPLEGAVARVGAIPVPGALVARVASAGPRTARRALDALVDDELLAQGARERRLDRDSDVAWALVAVRAGRAASRLLDAARSLGPPSDDELSLRVVVHAVLLRSPTLSPADGWAVASRVERAVAGATDADDFRRRAQGVHSTLGRVVTERVGPFGADAMTSAGVSLDPVFVAAAFALRTRGQTSPVVETPFGWHVIRLVDCIAPAPSAVAARRAALAAPVVELRVRSAVQALVAARRARSPIEIENGAEPLMASAVAAVR